MKKFSLILDIRYNGLPYTTYVVPSFISTKQKNLETVQANNTLNYVYLYVGDTTFQWTDGVIGVSLSRPRPDGYRLLYFTPMSSSRLYSVSTKVLQDYTVDWSAWNNTALFHQFQVVGYRGQFMQSTTSTMDENTGVLFYTLLCQDAIACWNSQSEYNMNTQGIVAQDSKRFSYTNDVKVDKNGMIWALSDRLHEYLFNKMNYSEINFRIFRIPVMAAIQGTVCEKGFLQSQDVMWK